MKSTIAKFLSCFESWLGQYTFQDKNLVGFRRGVYALLLFKMMFIWPEISMFYRHVLTQSYAAYLPHKIMFLPAFAPYYKLYWGVACAIVLFAICFKGNRFVAALVYLFSLNYLILANSTTNTGDSLLNFFVFCLIFTREKQVKNSAGQLLNNAVLLLLQLHFCLLYFLNGYGKIIRPYWRSGSIFSDIWTLPYFANTDMIPAWFLTPAINFLTAWSVMLFEFIFAFLIWFRPLRKSILIGGIFFHMGIMLFLSLPDFGLTMLVAYILFYDFKSRRPSKEVIIN